MIFIDDTRVINRVHQSAVKSSCVMNFSNCKNSVTSQHLGWILCVIVIVIVKW